MNTTNLQEKFEDSVFNNDFELFQSILKNPSFSINKDIYILSIETAIDYQCKDIFDTLISMDTYINNSFNNSLINSVSNNSDYYFPFILNKFKNIDLSLYHTIILIILKNDMNFKLEKLLNKQDLNSAHLNLFINTCLDFNSYKCLKILLKHPNINSNKCFYNLDTAISKKNHQALNLIFSIPSVKKHFKEKNSIKYNEIMKILTFINIKNF